MTDSFQTSGSAAKTQKFIVRILATAIVLAVAFLKPHFDEWLTGKSVAADPAVNVHAGDSDDRSLDSLVDGSVTTTDPNSQPTHSNPNDSANASVKESAATQPVVSSQATAQASQSKTKPSSKKTGKSQTAGSPVVRKEKPQPADTKKQTSSSKSSKPKLGKLKLIKGTKDEFLSTAGLFYGPGSADGHRLKHVLKHTKDNSSKPVHGIFNGDRDQILEWIDLAYTLAKKGGRGVRKKNQNGRTVYVVDLGKPIGKMGGQVGARKKFPACRYLQLVLEDGNHVVTAYPTNRF